MIPAPKMIHDTSGQDHTTQIDIEKVSTFENLYFYSETHKVGLMVL